MKVTVIRCNKPCKICNKLLTCQNKQLVLGMRKTHIRNNNRLNKSAMTTTNKMIKFISMNKKLRWHMMTYPQASSQIAPPQGLRSESGDDVDTHANGVIHLDHILPLDPTYADSEEYPPSGKPAPPHDFDLDVTQRIASKPVLFGWIIEKITPPSETSLPILHEKSSNPIWFERQSDVHHFQTAQWKIGMLKSAGTLPRGEGEKVQVLDSIRRWEDQFLQVLKDLNLASQIYGKYSWMEFTHPLRFRKTG